MERRLHRQFLGLTLALLALAGLVALATVALLAAEVRAEEFELPAWSQTLSAAKRFKLVLGNEAVLDKETGLVWEKSPGETDRIAGITDTDKAGWAKASALCVKKIVGGRYGWRLPSVEELASLIDPNAASAPFLPAGHPFLNIQSSLYWSATTIAVDPTEAWDVSFTSGNVTTSSKAGTHFVWCVRGDGPLTVVGTD